MDLTIWGYILMASIGGILGLWLIYLVIGPRKGK
jgi:hypothetical protein